MPSQSLCDSSPEGRALFCILFREEQAPPLPPSRSQREHFTIATQSFQEPTGFISRPKVISLRQDGMSRRHPLPYYVLNFAFYFGRSKPLPYHTSCPILHSAFCILHFLFMPPAYKNINFSPHRFPVHALGRFFVQLTQLSTRFDLDFWKRSLLTFK